MNKKHFIILGTVFFLGMGTIFCIQNLKPTSFERTYADKGNYILNISDVASLKANSGARTSEGAFISFDVAGLTGNTLAADASIRNITPLTGIRKVEVEASTTISITPGILRDGDIVPLGSPYSVEGNGKVETDFSFEFDYFFIKSEGASSDLSNLKVYYSCTDPDNYQVTVNLKFDTLPSSAINLLYDVGYTTGEAWINGKPNIGWHEMGWVSNGSYYSYTFNIGRIGDVRFEFATYLGGDRFMSYDDSWHPYETIVASNKTYYCSIASVPESSGVTTLFSVSESPYAELVTKTIEIYSVNDFHGYVDETDENAGIQKFATYFKEKGEDGNTLLLDQGDTWQGTFKSNYNKGEMITQIYNYAHFDARTIGNHDFDWGVGPVKDNTEIDYNGYSTPVLGANIYKYDFENKQFLNQHYDAICQSTVSYVLDNGVKVGIVGVIGEDQITSISSTYTEDFGFKPHIQVIKDEADALRADGCDIVICSIHGGQEDVIGNGLENYVDLVLCSHTHKNEFSIENGLRYLQFGKNGRNFGHITLNFNTQTKEVSSNYEQISASMIKSEVTTVDSTIASIYAEYASLSATQGSEVLHKNSIVGNFDSELQGPNLFARVMYEEAKAKDNDVILAYTNYTREDLNEALTYEDVFAAMPFENEVFIVETKGSEIIKRMGSNFVCYGPSDPTTLNWNDTYKIAVIDYLLYHTDTGRNYNFFPYGVEHIVTKLNRNLRETVVQYLRDNGYKAGTATLDSDDFLAQKYTGTYSFNRGAYSCMVPITYVIDRDGDRESIVRDTLYGGYYLDYAPADPTWEGHTFVEWRFSNGNSLAGQKCYGSYTVYAYFTLESSSVYDTGYLGYDDLKLLDGTNTSQTYTATKGGSSINITVTGYGNLIQSTQYSNVQMPDGTGFSVSAPSGYTIESFEVQIKYTYDNLTFFKGLNNSATQDTNISKSAGNSAYNYSSNPGCMNYFTFNGSGYNVYLLQLRVTLVPN